MTPDAIARRYVQKRTVTDDNGCWVWALRPRHDGYPQAKVNYRAIAAYRYSWLVYRGPIPEGLTIDHLCRNRMCVNPAHLEPVPIAENLRRAVPYRHPLAGRKNQTHCKQGHPLAGDNLVVRCKGPDRRPVRTCLTCERAAWKRYRARKCEANAA